MVSQRACERMTFACLLEQALADRGHEVYRGPYGGYDADLILGGVTSALSPGATYALAGLEHIGKALSEGTPLLLYVDDPDLAKTRSGAQSALRDTTRLYSDYLLGRRVSATRAPNNRQQVCILTAIEMLASEEWPPVLVPLHPWADPAIAAKRLRVTSEVVPVDLSPLLDPGVVFPLSGHAPSPPPIWMTDKHYSNRTLDPARVAWPVIPIDSATMKTPSVVYAVARGVHQGPIPRLPGWWTPTPLYVASAGTVYLCDSEESSVIGVDSPYYLTPDVVESLDDDEHRDLAGQQRAFLKETMWTLETLSSALQDSIGRATSSGKPDGSSPTSPTS